MSGRFSRLAIVGSVIAIVFLACGAGGYLLTRKVDLLPAANELPTAIRNYRNAGLPWEAKDLANPPVPDVDNAAELTQSVSLEQIHSAELYKALDDRDRTTAHRILDPLASQLTIAKRASTKTYLGFHRNLDLGPVLTFPELKNIKEIVEAFCYRAELEGFEGESRRAIDDLAAARRISKLEGQDWALISVLVEIASNAVTLKTYRVVAADFPNQPAILDRISAMLVANPVHPNFVRALKTEAYLSLAALRNVDPKYWEDVRGNPELRAPIDTHHLRRTGEPDDLRSKAYMTRELEFWTSLAPLLHQGADDPIRLGKATQSAGEAVSNRPEASYTTLRLSPHYYEEIGEAVARNQAMDLCTQALLKGLSIHARVGSYPKSISQIPGDWIDPSIGSR